MNSHLPHLVIIMEDKPYRGFVNGFLLHSGICPDQIFAESAGKGWKNTLEIFKRSHAAKMNKFPDRNILFLIDFDGKGESRRTEFKSGLPDDIRDRVFLIGCADDSEALKRELGGGLCEDIGLRLAENCLNGKDACRSGSSAANPWLGPQLAHNAAEIERLKDRVSQFIFTRP